MMRHIRRFVRLNKSLVTYAALVCIGLIGLFIGLIPSAQKCLVLAKDMQSLNREIVQIQKKVNVLSSLDQLSLEKSAQVVIAAVPINKSIPTFLSTIESIALKNGLYISDMDIAGSTSLATGSGLRQTKQNENTISAEVVLQGELESVRSFLLECIQVLRLLRVKNLSLSALPRSTFMNVKLEVESFYLSLPVSIGKPLDPLETFSEKELATLEKIASYPIAYTFIPQSVSSSQPTVPVEVPTIPVITDPFAISEKTLIRVPIRNVTPSPVEILIPQPTATMSATGSPKPTVSVAPAASPSSSPIP